MTLTESVYAVLSNTAAITALVPAARIKPDGKLQNLVHPYIVHQPLGATPTLIHSGVSAIKRQYQISIVGDTEAEVEAIAIVVRAALGNAVAQGIHTILEYDLYLGYSDETESHGWNLTFSIPD